jgi:hypothetical protein
MAMMSDVDLSAAHIRTQVCAAVDVIGAYREIELVGTTFKTVDLAPQRCKTKG